MRNIVFKIRICRRDNALLCTCALTFFAAKSQQRDLEEGEEIASDFSIPFYRRFSKRYIHLMIFIAGSLACR